MGNWGPGVFENDHAMDLMSIETARWADALRESLESPAAAWDDIEGLLIHVHLLARIGQDLPSLIALAPRPPAGRKNRRTPVPSSREVARAWKARYLALLAAGPADAARRAVVEATFDALIDVAPDDDGTSPAGVRTA